MTKKKEEEEKLSTTKKQILNRGRQFIWGGTMTTVEFAENNKTPRIKMDYVEK